MRPLHRLSVAEQATAHLRESLRCGHWRGHLPGVGRLAAELDVSRDTVLSALRQLEAEGLLSSGGLGRSRIITRDGRAARRLRVGILPYFAPLEEAAPISHLLLQLEHDLEATGCEVFFTKQTQVELQHNLRRLMELIRASLADAWIVVAGSRALLRWCSRQKFPCLALFGRTDGLLLARTGPDKLPAYGAATRQLIALGHHRIVMIVRRPRRKPVPGNVERAFLAELAAHGIKTGEFNLPEWEESPIGLAALLDHLFRVTPPTALIIDEMPLLIATMRFLLQRGIHVPDQVSLIASDYDTSFAWCHPPVAHIRWEIEPVIRHVLRWVGGVRRGHADRKIRNCPAQFISGGSIGPAPDIQLRQGTPKNWNRRNSCL